MDRLRISVDTFILFLFLILLPFTQNRAINDIAILATVFFCVVLIFRRWGRVLHFYSCNKALLASFFLYFVALFLSLLINHYSVVDDIKRVVQFAFVVIVITYSTTINWDIRIGKIRRWYLLLIAAAFAFYFISENRAEYSFFYKHFNTFGSVMLIAVFFICMSYKNAFDFAVIVAAVFLVLKSSSRTSLVGIILFAATSYFTNKFRTKKWIFKVALVLEIVFIATFTIVYPSLYNTTLGWEIELWSRSVFHKNFFSGRQIIWRQILMHASEKPIFGLGLGVVPSDLYDTHYSGHNLYLQTYLQGGLVNLAALYFVLISVFNKTIKNVSAQRNIFLSILLVMLFHSTFEVLLTQNQLAVGFCYWLLIGNMLKTQNDSVHGD